MYAGKRFVEKAAPLRQAVIGKLEVKLTAIFLVAAGLVLAFRHVAEEMLEGDSASFDRTILLAFRNNADSADPIGPPWVEEMVRDITAMGSFAVLGLIWFSLACYLVLVGRRAVAAWLTAAICGGLILDNVLKFGFERPRQEIVPAVARVFTTSFPSGHATVAAAAYLTVGMILADLYPAKAMKVYFLSLGIALTVLVGTSRVYLGLHYPTDVLAGWCVGGAWALFCWGAAQLVAARRSPRRNVG